MNFIATVTRANFANCADILYSGMARSQDGDHLDREFVGFEFDGQDGELGVFASCVLLAITERFTHAVEGDPKLLDEPSFAQSGDFVRKFASELEWCVIRTAGTIDVLYSVDKGWRCSTETAEERLTRVGRIKMESYTMRPVLTLTEIENYEPPECPLGD